jgi:hypothetical protein
VHENFPRYQITPSDGQIRKRSEVPAKSDFRKLGPNSPLASQPDRFKGQTDKQLPPSLVPASKQTEVDAMDKNQQARPVDEGVDASNEKVILDQIKVPAEEKKPSRNEKSHPKSNSKK